jgi:dihydrofolate reductase
MKIIAVEHLSLDGVYQAPGAPGEDTRGGLECGGWAAPNNDEVMGKKMAEGMATGAALLFGRRTYEHFHKYWPDRKDGNPFTDVLNKTQKYVASRTLKAPLPWSNSTLLEGDVAEAVARLKQKPGKDLAVLGSGDLCQTLLRHGLLDELLLMIHPVVLGRGLRFFPEGLPSGKLQLAEVRPTTTGVLLATYRPAGALVVGTLR